MSSTFTTAAGTAFPLLVTQWSATSVTRHLVHEVLGSPWPDVTLQPAGPRTGTISALFEDESGANLLYAALRSASAIDFSDDDSDSASMSFFANGNVTLTTDSQRQSYWTVTFDYMEVQQ